MDFVGPLWKRLDGHRAALGPSTNAITVNLRNKSAGSSDQTNENRNSVRFAPGVHSGRCQAALPSDRRRRRFVFGSDEHCFSFN
jgi:hypothetical protein